MGFQEFLSECREKDVFKNFSIYIVSSWVLLQVVSLLAQPLNLPNSSLTVLLLVLLIAFPLYAFFLWQYRIHPENVVLREKLQKQALDLQASSKSGVHISSEGSLEEVKTKHKKFQKTYFTSVFVLGFLSLSASAFIIRTNFFNTKEQSAIPMLSAEKVSDKIAVLNFDNNTGDSEFDIVGKMTVDWIMHGITQNKIGQVISPKIVEDYSEVVKASMFSLDEESVMQKYLKPSKVIDGSFYLKDRKLLFQSSIKDGSMSETLISLGPIECPSESPLDCVEDLKQRILGFLVTENEPLENLQESPPRYEAYKYLLEAKNRYGEKEQYLELLNKAINSDDTFFEAKVSLAEYYYNYGDYKVADSIINDLSKNVNNNKRQWNLLKMYEALIDGDNGNTYKYLRNEYEIHPFEISTNTSLMTVALRYVNKPEDVNELFNDINVIKELKSKQKDFEDCVQCEFRYRQKGWADIELSDFQSTIDLLKPFQESRGYLELKKILVRAYVLSSTPDTAVDYIVSGFDLGNASDFANISLSTGKFYRYVKKDSLARKYLKKAIEGFDKSEIANNQNAQKIVGTSYLYLKDYKNAIKYLKMSVQGDDVTRKYLQLGLLAIAYHQNGNFNQSKLVLDQLEQERKPYLYGNVDYTFARFYGAIGEEKEMFKYLKRAVAAGKWFNSTSYHNDVFLLPYKDSEAFQDILKYWH